MNQQEYFDFKGIDIKNITYENIVEVYVDRFARGVGAGESQGKTAGMEFAARMMDQMAHRAKSGVEKFY